MCMPTNFGIRKKTTYSFKRKDKKTKKDDNFFDDCEKFLEDKNENISIKPRTKC